MAIPSYQREQALAAEDLCRFLAACFYQPGPEFREERLFDSMLEAARRVDPALAERTRRLGQAFAAEDAQALLVDYTRLFLGPGQPVATPYGSSWLGTGPAVMQEATLDVMELYRQGGFEIDEAFQELPDHVAVELEFLYLLAFNRNEAREHGRDDALSQTELLQRRFLTEHLGAWIGSFAAAVKSGANTAFYRELAELAETFVRREAGLLTVH